MHGGPNTLQLSSLSRVATFVQLWHDADLDIVCVQETWVGRPGPGGRSYSAATVALWLRLAAEALGLAPYTLFFATNTAVPCRPSPSRGVRTWPALTA